MRRPPTRLATWSSAISLLRRRFIATAMRQASRRTWPLEQRHPTRDWSGLAHPFTGDRGLLRRLRRPSLLVWMSRRQSFDYQFRNGAASVRKQLSLERRIEPRSRHHQGPAFGWAGRTPIGTHLKNRPNSHKLLGAWLRYRCRDRRLTIVAFAPFELPLYMSNLNLTQAIIAYVDAAPDWLPLGPAPEVAPHSPSARPE